MEWAAEQSVIFTEIGRTMGNLIFVGTGSEWFWNMIQFIIVVISIIFLFFQIRTQTSSHVVNTLEIIRCRWNSHDMLNARLHVCNNWLNGDHSFDAGAEHIAEFFEELGLYLRMKSVPQNVIWETQSYYIEYYYDIFYNGILKMRKNLQDETLFSEFKYLNEQMQKISEKKTVLVSGRADDEVRFFLEREIHTAECLMHLKAVDVASSSLVAEGGCEVKTVIKGCSPELGSNAVVLQNSPRGQD